jgi:predicted nucleic acid-binding protein
MAQGTVVDLDMDVALSAAKLSVDRKLPLADSVMLATARRYGAILWTQDAHFSGIQGVQHKRAS